MKKTAVLLLTLGIIFSLFLPAFSADAPAEEPADEAGISDPSEPVDSPVVYPEPAPSQGRFTDIIPGKFYAEAVDWAVENGITDGITPAAFCPDSPCTRAQAVTFLWRAAGKPAPKSLVNPFVDVRDGMFYSDAVIWAVENGITNGTAANRFSPSAVCTRAQIVTFLHRAVGAPETAAGSFSDVPKGSFCESAVRWAVAKNVTNGISDTKFGPNQSCTRGHIVTFLFRAKDIPINPKQERFSRSYSLYYADTMLDTKLETVVNRPYINVRVLCDCFDFDPKTAAGKLSWPVRYSAEGEYIALSDAVKLCQMGVMFDSKDNSVHLYILANLNWTPTVPASGAKKAYIRLEDIMADEGINGRFTHENLNELRFFGTYLRDHTDAFYIAWIPLYVNPGRNMRNDISRDESFYNADFVFTLDCLVADGGQIGLHGLTHQHADEVSADGYEFGDDIHYTKEQILNIFKQAEDICFRMGYTYSFFEFPHYTASDFQKQVAEKYFDIIYQQYAGAAPAGRIVSRKIGSHTCLWVPTPADWVKNAYDSDGIVQRLTASHDAGQEISLYFHPAMDSRAMTTRIQGDVMTFSYNEKTGILSRIIRLIDSWGYRFQAIK